LGIGTNVVVVWLLWAVTQVKAKHAKGEIALLKAQKEATEALNNSLNIELENAKQQRDAYAERLPDTAFNSAAANWTHGEHGKANDTVKGWVEREGDTISQLC
jgi:hypothetical protein